VTWTRSPGFLIARVLFHCAFLSLWIVWLASPETPTPAYVWLVLTASALVLIPLSLQRLRSAWLALLRRWIGALDVLAVNLALLLGLVEGGVRLLGAAFPSPIFVQPNAKAEEAIRHHRLLPGSRFRGFPVNSLGFADEEFARERRPGVGRIVALGDSFAVGSVPYPQNFLTLLDDQLDASEPWEVLNFGVAGVGPREYLQLYRTEGKFFDPDLVLLCFFNGNDFRVLRQSSLLHSGSLYLFTIPQRLWSVSREPEWVKDGSEGMRPDTFEVTERERLRITRRQLDKQGERRYTETFEQLQTMIREIGDRLRVVIIPDEYQVNRELWRSLLAGAEAAYDADLPSRRLGEFLERQGVRYLDLLEPLREAEATERTYIPNNTHWNARGNRVAAQAIAAWLTASGQTPRSGGLAPPDPAGTNASVHASPEPR
jgi:lysophospholipase L1-like esterase